MKQFSATAGRIARFSIVGALNTAIDMAVFLVLALGLGMPVVPANLIAFAAAVANSYLLNRNWTFHDSGGAASRGNVAKFVIFSAMGAGLATIVIWALARAGLPLILAKLLSILVGMSWNYVTMRLFVFPAR